MYTRCPSCRAEISFEPPANAASLPDGYKHKIKCPSCGVTIGVKIPRLDADAVQPTFTPANPNATPSETVFSAAPVAVTEKEAAKEMKKAKKSGGRGKSFFMFLISLLLVLVSGLGYLSVKGTIDVELLQGFQMFDGISPIALMISDMAAFKAASFDVSIGTGIVYLLPTILFLLSGISAIVSIICLAVGKYSKVFNLIFGLLICGAAICTLLYAPLYLLSAATEAGIEVEFSIGEYFKDIIANKMYLAFVGAGLGVLSFLFSLFFLGGKKQKAE